MKTTKIAHIIVTCILALAAVILGISLILTISHLDAEQTKFERERGSIYHSCKHPYTIDLKDSVTFETKLFTVGDSIEDVIYTYGLPHERSYTRKSLYVSSAQSINQRYLTYIISDGALEDFSIPHSTTYPYVKFTYSKDGIITAVDYFETEEAYRASLT